MVNIKIDQNNMTAAVSGDVDSIVAELAVAISEIYNSIKTTNGERAANMFRMGLLIVMAPDAPTWDPTNGMIVINKKKSAAPTDQS